MQDLLIVDFRKYLDDCVSYFMSPWSLYSKFDSVELD